MTQHKKSNSSTSSGTLTKSNLLKVKSVISKLKRSGWKLDNNTEVMLINDKPVTYGTFKKLIKGL